MWQVVGCSCGLFVAVQAAERRLNHTRLAVQKDQLMILWISPILYHLYAACSTSWKTITTERKASFNQRSCREQRVEILCLPIQSNMLCYFATDDDDNLRLDVGPISQPRCANNALDTTAKPWPAFLRPSDGDSSVLGPESFKLETKRTDLQTATQRALHEPPQRNLNASATVLPLPPAGGVLPPPPPWRGAHNKACSLLLP